MKPRRSTDSGAPRTAPVWVKVLVALHVIAVTIWALPRPADSIMDGKVPPAGTGWLLYWNAKYLKELNPIKAYLLCTGNWQYWDMFAPDPAGIDWYCTATVTYRDGSVREILYPRMYSLSLPMKYVKERFRKFYERAHDEKNPRLFPVFAQAMALRAYDDRANPPMKVALFRHWLTVADPGQPQETAYHAYNYYTYAVDSEWLKRATEAP